MKICFFVCYPPDKRGSALYYYELTKALLRIDNVIEVHVFGSRTSEHAQEEIGTEIPVSRIWSPNSFYLINVLRKVLDNKPDLIHVHFSFYSPLYCLQLLKLLALLRLLGVKVVLQYDEVILLNRIHEVTSMKTMMKGLLLSLTRTVCALSSKVIVWKPLAKRILVDHYKISEEKISIIPHAIFEPKKVVNSEKAKALLGLRGKLVILLFGILEDNKGIGCAIDAFKLARREVPQSFLVIAGSPNPYRFKTEESKRRYMQTIDKFLGYMDNVVIISKYISEDEKDLLFSASDIIILPYTFTYKCSSSGVLYTAAGYGKPVIATKIPFFEDDVKNELSGILVPPRDSKSLANAIIHLIKNSEVRARLSANLKLNAEERSWTSVASKLLEIYKEVACTNGLKR